MTTSEITLLRLNLADPDDDLNGEGDVFTDAQLTDLLNLHDGDINAATSAGWYIKAGNVADWYQASADGTGLSRNQVFDHCRMMARDYDQRSAGRITSVLMSVEDETAINTEGDFA